MSTNRFGDLEVLVHAASGQVRHEAPLLFVHGAYTGAWCWEEFFLPWFAARGWDSYALSLSGHGGSGRTSRSSSCSLSDFVDDLHETAVRLPSPPVLIGHSMGGMVVQKYLERADVRAAALLCSVPPQGLYGAFWNMALNHPSLMMTLARIQAGGLPDLETMRELLFYQPVEAECMQRYLSLSQPESHRVIWDMTLFSLPNLLQVRHPQLLVVGTEFDRIIPPSLVWATANTYGVGASILPQLGHALMLEKDWKLAAQHIEDWLLSQLR